MANNLAQKEEKEKWSNKVRRWTDTGWMYVKKATKGLSDRLKGVGISASDEQQKQKNIKNSLEIQRKKFELKRRY